MSITRQVYAPLTNEQASMIRTIKQIGEDLLEALEEAGPSREISLAKTKVEEAVMWAVKGVTASAS